MSMIGKILGTFECTALLGKGGMGEVYRAKDQKLGRDVAIKVLPEEFAKDADRVARFQREAKLLASLNHPNIASIYGLEESEGTHFLVLELIEGDTLADRLKHGAIPVEEALKIALQISEALEAAHEKGVIHRDLKPANIKVTPDGKVKVLDFGLAKAYAGDQKDLNLSNSPTLSAAATQQGVILGTAAYMSPEQARGNPVDKRADIWAFGVVLFEMLTGRQIFSENTVSDTLASVLKSEPEWKSLPPNLHPRIRFLLERCLKKEPKNRYSGISDARVEIQEVLADPSGIFVQPVTAVKPRKKLRLGIPWVAAISILSVIIAGVAVWKLKPTKPPQVIRLDYDLPKDQEFTESYLNSVAVSADDKKIVYVANNQLYLKYLNEYTARPIQGTDENPAEPFFSPDGQWVGYFSRSDRCQLKKISIMGGVSVPLCETKGVCGATWGTDDMILFGQLGGIMRVSASGGTPEEFIKGGENEFLLFPQILLDGKSVLFTILPFLEKEFQVAIQSFESGERKVLFPGGPAQYLSTGHLVYGLENTLFAIRFDLDTLKPVGSPVPLIEGIFRMVPDYPTHSAISNSGTLVYIPGRMGTTDQRDLVWVDRDGKEELIDVEPKTYRRPNISPDGTRVAFSINKDGNVDIHIYDLVRGTMTRLTFNEADDFAPVWTPDAKRIIFGSDREGMEGIFWKAADGTGKVEQIASMPDASIRPMSLSSDGNTLFFGQYNPKAGWYNIGMLSMEGDRAPKLLLQEAYSEVNPQISPDGRWMAYSSTESGQDDVYARPFPDLDQGKWQVSTGGGSMPLWSPDGRELFYRSSDAVMGVSIETELTFNAGKPVNLFRGDYIRMSTDDWQPWDIHPDGRRFLMIKSAAASDGESTAESRKINVVLNWFEELKERVPVN